MRVTLEGLRDALTTAALEFVVPTGRVRRQSCAIFFIGTITAVRFTIAAPCLQNTLVVAALVLVWFAAL